MNFSRMIQSFKDAMRGVSFVFRNEQNFRLQILVGLLVVLSGWYFGLTKTEWIVIIFLIISVITLEFLNSAVEKFADILKPRLDLHVQVVKDIMAGVVFLASCGAVIIGVLIFYPYIIDLVFSW